MPRSLKIRKPRPTEVRELQDVLEGEGTARQRRRAEAIVLYAAGLEAVEIAAALGVHIKTVYSDLQAFEALGVACVRERMRGGAPARITPEQTASASFMKGAGCSHCGKSGYRGRIGIYELMVMNSKVRELAFAGATTVDLRKAAVKSGMTTLYQDGINKVLAGITTLEEVFRVAKREEV